MTHAAVDRSPLSATLSRWVRLALRCIWALPFIANAGAPGPAPDSVQQEVAAIDARSSAQGAFRERPVQGVSAEGARVSAWGASGAIEKISLEALGERGRVLQDFYWRRGSLIAARTRRLDYGANIMELPKDTPAPTTIVEDERVEFAGNRLLRWRHLDQDRPVSGASAQRRAAELRARARSFRRLIDAPETAGTAAGCFWSCAREQRGECLRYQCR